jgi:hypothetical protein
LGRNGTGFSAKTEVDASAIGIASVGWLPIRNVTSLGDQELPPIASIGDLVKALRLFGVGVGIDESVPTVRHELAYSVIGAAERNAIMTDHHAKAAAAGPGDLAEFAGCTLDGAACHNDFDALALLGWRATRTTQAIQKAGSDLDQWVGAPGAVAILR